MKKFLLTSLIASLFALAVQAQDLTISGGNNVSVMICADGAVYAWGMNYWEVNNNKAGNGNLGTSNTTDDYVTKPTKVNMPSEALPVKQVDAGSGSHFVAMGCNGTVWCWGNNATKQAGNPSAGNPVLVPVQVKAGEVPSASGYLEGVSYISGGNDENYAILATGELVAWGQNDVGQLGCGRTSTYESTPVYVCKPDGSHLTGVIMVEAGDETGYALVDEDGDGIGTVYSWGGDDASQLGRVASTSEPKYYACPCYKNAGDPTSPSKGEILDNIVSLTAGDCMAIMIDKDSYVWSFGHGSWGGMCGSWAWGCDCCYANQVLGGETGEPYLKAKAVSAGQGFGMAVTLDGKAVAWGNNGATNRSGGNLGNGGDDASPDPVYIRKTATTLMENCASISDGDTWGFITTTDNEIWTWGDNCVGQLGIGSTTRSKYATKMNRLCQVPDPKPVISFPEDFYTCVPFSYELKSNFVNTNNNYSYEWFKDGKALTSLGNKKTSITVDEVGTYSLKLSYIGANSPCGMDPVESEITISAYEPEFTVPEGLTFCPPNMKPHVNGEGVYNYYTSQTGGFLLGTSYQDKETSFESSAVTEKTSDGKYTIYVEEAGNAAGVTFSQTASFTGEKAGKGNEGYIKIQVYKDIVLDSLSFMVSSYYWGSGKAVTGSIGIFGGANSPDKLPLYEGESFTTEEISADQLVTVPVNVSLKGSSGGEMYWLAFNALSEVCLAPTGTGTLPVADNLDGKTLQIVDRYLNGAAKTPSPFRNLYFHTSQHFCDRIPMTLTEDCPCEKPDDVKITADKTALCPGESATLTTNSQSASLFSYVWYDADGNADVPENVASSTKMIDFDNPGTYKVVIYDKTQQFETTSCKKEAEIEITAAPYPSVTIGEGGDYCDGESVDDIALTFTGTAPFEFTYTENAGTDIDGLAATASGKIVPSTDLAAGVVSKEYTYAITSLKDANCSAPAANYAGSATVTIVGVPTATITATDDEVCAPNTITLTGESDISGATLAWSGDGSGSAATQTANGAKEYTYELTATNKVGSATCVSEKATKKVAIDAKPTVSISSDKTAICSDGTINVTATAKVGSAAATGGKYTWTGATGTGATATVTKTAMWPNPEEVVVKVDYETAAGCKADQSSPITLTFNPVPTAPTEDNKASYCMNPSASDVILEAMTANSSCDLQWYEKDGTTKLSNAPKISVKAKTDYEYKVTQLYEGCESEPTTITIVVNDKLKPKIEIENDELCISGLTEVTVQDAGKFTTVTWSGSAATSGFGSTASTKTPTFTAPSVTTKTDYTVHVYVANAECDGENEATITVYPTPTVTLAASPASICDGVSSTITATISGDDNTGSLTEYTWKNATETDKTKATVTGANTTASDKTETITYSYTSSHGCKATDATTTVTMLATPVAPTTEAYTKCLDATAETLDTYVSKYTGTLNWYESETATSTISTPDGATNKVISPAKNYYVSQTIAGCEGPRAALPVTINANLEPVITTAETSGKADNDGVVCQGTAITLGTSGSYTETWSSTNGSTYLQTTSNSKTFLGTAPAGSYTINLEVEDANGCKGSATTTLVVNAIPTATISSLDAKCEDVTESQTITATVEPSTLTGEGTWTGNVTKIDEKSASFTPSVAEAGKHEISYSFTSEAGCEMSAPVKTSVDVYGMPAITIAPSVEKVCQAGATLNDKVTMIPTVTSSNTNSATFEYTGDAGLTVNSVDGSFMPADASVATHTISVVYTDGNGCKDDAETSVVVNAQPVTDISANASSICDYDSDGMTLVADITGGTFSGQYVSDGKFVPEPLSASKTVTVSYDYVDANGCTAETSTKDIKIVHVDAPMAKSAATSSLSVSNQTEVPILGAIGIEGASINWYDHNSIGAIIAEEGFVTRFISDTDNKGNLVMKPGIYTAYATQTVEGCESSETPVSLTITDCSATSPEVVVYHACANQTASVTLTAETTIIGGDKANFYWFANQSDVPTIQVTDLSTVTTKEGTGETLVVSGDKLKTVGTVSYYVSEYLGGTDQCFSAGTQVDIIVHALPEVEITDPGMICSTSGDIEIKYSPASDATTTSTLTGDGISANMWTPQFDDGSTNVKTTTLKLETSKVWGSGTDVQATCENEVTRDVKVTNVEMPETGIIKDGAYVAMPTVDWGIVGITTLPAMEVKYASAADFESVAMTVKNSVGQVIGTESGVEMYPRISEVGTYTFDVQQTVNGCPSEVAVSTYRVVECPTPTPILSVDPVCEDVSVMPSITLDINGNATPGKYEWYYIPEGQTIEDVTTATGTTKDFALSDTYKTAGNYKFMARQDGVDAAGFTCWSEFAEVTFTVNALPDVEIQTIGTSYVDGEPGVLCYGGGTFMATAKVNGVVTGGGVWETMDTPGRIDESTGIIDPTLSKDSEGNPIDINNTAKYTYTDANGCVNSDTKQFHIEYPEVPTTEKYIGITSKPVDVVVTAGNIEISTQTTTEINWYRTENAKSAIGTTNPWTVDSRYADPKEVTEDDIVFYVSQTVNGCVSERASQYVQIVDCPWEVKEVTPTETCAGVAFENGMKAVADDAATQIDKWSWSLAEDVNNEVVETGSESSFTQTKNDVPGITTYYVRYHAYYDYADEYCWSAPKAVTTTVHKNPEVTFAEKTGSVCYTFGSVKVNVNVVPGDNGNGATNAVDEFSWSTSGNAEALPESSKTSTYAYFETEKNNKETETYTLTYSVTDVKGCVDSDTRVIEVVYLEKPETEGFYAMTSQTNPVEVNVTSTVASGAVIHWFSDEYAMSPSERKNKDVASGSAGAEWLTPDAYDRTVNKTYYARQYDEGADCYSEATPATVVIVPCPIPTVNLNAPKACIYDDASARGITAETSNWSERDASKSEYRFYLAPDDNDPQGTSKDGESYVPTNIDGAEIYSYYVTEYNSLPLEGLTNPEGCESSRAKTTVTIIETPAPVVNPQTAAVCEGEINPEFKAVSGKNDILWYESDPGEKGIPTVGEDGSELTFVPNGTDASETPYDVWAVKYADGCYSARTHVNYIIKRIPLAPTSEKVEVCFGEAAPLTAVAEDNAVVGWYSDNKREKYLTQGLTYQPKVTDVNEYTYYIAQQVNGCWGPTSSVEYEIKEIPNMPVAESPGSLCEYDAAPVLKSNGENIKWYSANQKTEENLLASGENEYNVKADDMTAGTKRYYVTQTVRGCESDLMSVVFTVNPKPANPIVVGASICEGDTVIPTLSTNFNTDVWYSDEDLENQLVKGYTYTPSANEVGAKDKYYYVIREMRGCYSDVVVDTLHVIAKPTFFIGDDTTFCIYDKLLTVQAQNFTPAISEGSYIDWKVSTGSTTKSLSDNADHNLYPASIATTEGKYTVRATYRYKQDNAYCNSDEISMNFTIKGRARTPIVFSTIICAGENIEELRSLGSPNTVWNSLDNTLPTTWHGQSYQFQPGQSLDTGSYRFEIYDMNIYDDSDAENVLGCESIRDTITMVVAPGAKTKLFGRDSVCMGSVGESYYTQYEKGSQYFWSVSGENLNYSKDANATSVRYIDWMTTGVDTIVVYEQTWAGCEGYDTLIVKIAPTPKALFSWTMPGASNIVELVDSTQQDSLWTTNENGERIGLPISYEMAWNFGHIGTPENQIDTIVPFVNRHRPIQEGGYLYGYNCPILTVTNDYGCTSTYTECIFVNIASSLSVPTAFSPTNPAHSVRSFAPKGFNIATCEISVYDKWGNLLWFSNEVEDGMFVGAWDGRYEGKMMKSDVYIWKMEATFLDGQKWQGFDAGNGKKTKFGSVTLIR